MIKKEKGSIFTYCIGTSKDSSRVSVLCKQKLSHVLIGQIKRFTASDANFIDSETNWSGAKKWVEWWMRPNHLKRYCTDTSKSEEVWEQCPSGTNAIERKNLDSKETLNNPLRARNKHANERGGLEYIFCHLA